MKTSKEFINTLAEMQDEHYRIYNDNPKATIKLNNKEKQLSDLYKNFKEINNCYDRINEIKETSEVFKSALFPIEIPTYLEHITSKQKELEGRINELRKNLNR